jgi:hypothetical protein
MDKGTPSVIGEYLYHVTIKNVHFQMTLFRFQTLRPGDSKRFEIFKLVQRKTNFKNFFLVLSQAHIFVSVLSCPRVNIEIICPVRFEGYLDTY